CAAWARELVTSQPDWRPTDDFSNVVSFEDHVRLYCEPDMGRHLSFILDTPYTSPLQEIAIPQTPADCLQWCVEEVECNGLEPFVVDINSPEIAALGWSVFKVLVPGLVPITAVHRMPALNSPRLYQVPERVGRSYTMDQFNPIPHPFP